MASRDLIKGTWNYVSGNPSMKAIAYQSFMLLGFLEVEFMFMMMLHVTKLMMR